MKKVALLIVLVFFIGTFARGLIVQFKDEPSKTPIRTFADYVNHLKSVTENGIKAISDEVERGNYKVLWIARAVYLPNGDANLMKKLQKNPKVAKVYPDFIVPLMKPVAEKDAKTPNNWNIRDFAVEKVWKDFHLTGKGIIVGQIDTGVEGDHPDLKGKIVYWRDFLSNSLPVDHPVDSVGHGTHTAGTICGGSASGVPIGVAPDAKIAAARCFSWFGANTHDILDAMQWLLDPDGDPNTTNDRPRVINNSWGGPISHLSVFEDAVKAWVKAGIVPVFSAGNSGPNPRTIAAPAASKLAIAVAALKTTTEVASFSSRGPAVVNGEEYIKPDIAAPGQNVYSAIPGKKWGYKSGTSMAGPFIAGVVALMLEANPNLTVDDVKKLLYKHAIDLGAPGKDNDYGWGVVNVYETVKEAYGKRLPSYDE